MSYVNKNHHLHRRDRRCVEGICDDERWRKKKDKTIEAAMSRCGKCAEVDVK